jgi:hypothetical protein
MATVKFNQVALGTLQTALYVFPNATTLTLTNKNTLGLITTSLVNTAQAAVIRLEIYSGTPPTTWTGITSMSGFAGQLLVSFNCAGDNAELSSSTAGGPRSFLIGKSMRESSTAVGTGTATWFCLRRLVTTSTSTWDIPDQYDLTDCAAIIGTVGAIGSGADIEVASTSITTGSTYKSAGFLLSIPSSYTV